MEEIVFSEDHIIAATSSLHLRDIILKSLKVDFALWVLKVSKFSTAVHEDWNFREEGATTEFAEESLYIHIYSFAAFAQKFISLDSGQAHTIEVEKLESHLNDDILHGHITCNKFDILNLIFFEFIIISFLFDIESICVVLIVDKERIVKLGHKVDCGMSSTQMLVQICIGDPRATIFFVVKLFWSIGFVLDSKIRLFFFWLLVWSCLCFILISFFVTVHH